MARWADDQKERDPVATVLAAIFVGVIVAFILLAAFAAKDHANRGPQWCPQSPGVEGCQ